LAALLIVLFPFSTANAIMIIDQELVDELEEFLLNDVPEDELVAEIVSLAAERDGAPNDLAIDLVEEVREIPDFSDTDLGEPNVDDGDFEPEGLTLASGSSRNSISAAGGVAALSGGAGTATKFVNLPTAHKGAIFGHASTTLTFNHGHVGIYYDKNHVIEAPGKGHVVRKTAVSNRTVAKARDSFVMKVTKSSTNTEKVAEYKRDAAVAEALTWNGKAFNTNFLMNKTGNTNKVNCSQLVWLACKDGAGIDLDYNGGSAVMPVDIARHARIRGIWVAA
jgi:uncharacterized protein YycO